MAFEEGTYYAYVYEPPAALVPAHAQRYADFVQQYLEFFRKNAEVLQQYTGFSGKYRQTTLGFNCTILPADTMYNWLEGGARSG
jgi:hypothetical protein